MANPPLSMQYTSVPGFTGTDSFSYALINADGAQSNTATVTVSVVAPATESPTNTQVPPATSIVDANGTTWTIASAKVAKNGIVDATTSGVTLLAYENHVLWYKNATLWQSWSGTAWSMGVSTDPRPPAPPVVSSGSISTTVSTAVTIIPGVTSGTAKSSVVVTQPTHGTVVVSGINLIYTPALGYTGSDTFTFQVLDASNQASNTATISLTIKAATVNNNKLIYCSDFTGPGWQIFNAVGAAVGTTLVANPIDGKITAQQLTFPTGRDGWQFTFSPNLPAGTYTASIYSRVTTAANQQFYIAYYVQDFPGKQFSTKYLPTTAWTRTAGFTFTVSATDPITAILIENIESANASTPLSAAETIQFYGLQIEPGSVVTAFAGCAPLPAPVANAVTTSALVSTATTINPNVTGTYDTVAITKAPTHGSAVVAGKAITYTPVANYTGSDTLSYTVTNATGTSAVAIVSITVANAASLPNPLFGFYWFGFNGPSIATMQSTYPKFKHLSFAPYQCSTGDGQWIPAVSDSTFKSDLVTWLSSGRTANIMIGSSADNPDGSPGNEGNGTLLNTSQGDQLIAALKRDITQYGFTGYEWDLEDESKFNAATVEYVDAKMIAWKSTLLRGNAPRRYELNGSSDIKRAIALAVPYDYTACQWYYPKSTLDSDGQGGIIVSDTNGWASAGITPANKVIISFDPVDSPIPVTDCGTVYADVKRNLTVRGVFLWSTADGNDITGFYNALSGNF